MLAAELATGRLLELHLRLGDWPSADVRFERGVFEHRLQDLEKTTAAHRNVYTPQQPLGSLAEAVTEGLLQSKWFGEMLGSSSAMGDLSRASAAALKLLNRQSLAPLDELFSRARQDSAERFTIPAELCHKDQEQENALLALCSAFVFKYCDDLFPQGSWPWTAAREAVFVANHRATYTTIERDRVLNSPDTGPIGCLILAKLLARVEPSEAKTFVTRGLTRLSVEAFRKDYQLVLQGTSPLAKSAANIAAAFGKLEPAQLEDLARALPTSAARFVRTTARVLRESKEPCPQEALAAALDEWWNESLRTEVRAALLQMSHTEPRTRTERASR